MKGGGLVKKSLMSNRPYLRRKPSPMRNFLFIGLLFSDLGLAAQQPCAAHLGGSWYINCKSLVSHHGQDVVTFSDWTDPVATVNLDIYSTKGVLEAQVRSGKLVKGDPERFVLKSGVAELSLIDDSTDRIICVLKKVASTTKQATCQVDVWLDLFVRGAGYFHCDPESSTDPTMEMMRSSTFTGMGAAVTLE